VGVVPGQSAMAAAPAALAQLSASANANGDQATTAAVSHAAAAQATISAAAPPVSPISAGTPKPSAIVNTSIPTPPRVVHLMFSPVSPVAAGSTFQVPIVLTGGTDIASVPLQIQYDPARLSLVNVSQGDFLSSDGKAVGLVHSDDGAGGIKVVASRPPGAAGVGGAGVVCVLSFQAKAAGETVVSMTRAEAVNSAQQQVAATGTPISIVVK
jgi:general secretion pathway protein D